MHGLDPTNWMFLTSGAERPAATRALAEQYGHKFAKTEDGYQTHGIVTHVIDQEGRLRANFHGLKFDPTNLVVYVNALVNEAQGVHDAHEPSLWATMKKWFQ